MLFRMLLAGDYTPPGPVECLPYTIPPPNAVNANLDKPMLYLVNNEMDINLCEELV